MSNNNNTVNAFADVVRRFSYKGKGPRALPLTNITFFVGAGFSKSWDAKYPLGTELFDFEEMPMFSRHFESLGSFVEQCGFDPTEKVTYEIFTECYYKLEMLKKYPEIRPRYLDSQTLCIIESEFKTLIWKALNDRVTVNYLNDGTLCFKKTTAAQENILEFFHQMLDQADGSKGIPEGIRTNFITTNYDYLLEGIIDNHCSYYDDFHYVHTYRGFTPKLINGDRNISPVHAHWLVNNLIKINGGLEIRKDDGFFNIDHRNKTIEEVVVSPPEIILPSKEQDYTSIYFKSVFSKATRLLQESKVLVIVGYSFPKDDALLRFVLRHFAEDDRDLVNKMIFYIDLGDHNEMRSKVRTICPSDFKLNGRVFCFNKGFSSFVKKMLQAGLP